MNDDLTQEGKENLRLDLQIKLLQAELQNAELNGEEDKRGFARNKEAFDLHRKNAEAVARILAKIERGELKVALLGL